VTVRKGAHLTGQQVPRRWTRVTSI
jgi:hypothetical protein